MDFDRFEDALRARAEAGKFGRPNDYMAGFLLSMVKNLGERYPDVAKDIDWHREYIEGLLREVPNPSEDELIEGMSA